MCYGRESGGEGYATNGFVMNEACRRLKAFSATAMCDDDPKVGRKGIGGTRENTGMPDGDPFCGPRHPSWARAPHRAGMMLHALRFTPQGWGRPNISESNSAFFLPLGIPERYAALGEQSPQSRAACPVPECRQAVSPSSLKCYPKIG
jgi:hypothetical protein